MIPRVRSGEGDMYADLILPLCDREVVSDRPSAQEKSLTKHV